MLKKRKKAENLKKEMETHSIFYLLIITASFLLILPPNYALITPLRRDYYRYFCPNLEQIVHNAVKKKLHETSVTGPATVRLFFHDCFVHGCDASVMIASPTNNAEKDAPDDLSLAGDRFDTVIRAKEAVDSVSECKNRVSCADILALATRDAIVLSGGPNYGVELGRRDGRVSRKASVKGHLPLAHFNYKQLKAMFATHGLSEVDLIALSGAHTIGFSHCSQFSKRIYNYNSQSSIDPTLHQGYAKELQQKCPRDVDHRTAVALDPTTPMQFDNAFYKNLKQGKGLLTSDQALLATKKSKRVVNAFASNNTLFERVFVAAITRLGRVGVKTGNQGEIRRDCRFVGIPISGQFLDLTNDNLIRNYQVLNLSNSLSLIILLSCILVACLSCISHPLQHSTCIWWSDWRRLKECITEILWPTRP